MSFMRPAVFTALFIMLSGGLQAAFAHGGGLDGQGCHTQRSTGAYHCH
jgi:hypothetical protein